MSPDPDVQLQDRAILAAARRKPLELQARRALLSACEDLTVCSVVAVARLREQPDAKATLLARLRETETKRREAEDRAEILAVRLDRIEPRSRPHYSPECRFRILCHMRTYLLSVEEAAYRFRITPQTLYNWLSDSRRHPDAQSVGSLLKPVPPLRRYADVVRAIARRMKDSGFGGAGQVAATLARLGWKISATSAWRFAKERSIPPPQGPGTPTSKAQNCVYGRYPNHLWLVDITRVPTIFPFLHFHLAVVLDAFSRMPLGAAVFLLEPSASALSALLTSTIGRCGAPRHLVSDQGAQFTATLFRDTVRRLGVRQRFGALGQHGSITLVERFFRTLKGDLDLHSRRPWHRREFERRLVAALVRYAFHRPHSAIGRRPPAELYFGISDQAPILNSAPRGRAGEPGPGCPFVIALLDPETETLPILVPRAA
jgi:transposase InsO family protein